MGLAKTQYRLIKFGWHLKFEHLGLGRPHEIIISSTFRMSLVGHSRVGKPMILFRISGGNTLDADYNLKKL